MQSWNVILSRTNLKNDDGKNWKDPKNSIQLELYFMPQITINVHVWYIDLYRITFKQQYQKEEDSF